MYAGSEVIGLGRGPYCLDLAGVRVPGKAFTPVFRSPWELAVSQRLLASSSRLSFALLLFFGLGPAWQPACAEELGSATLQIAGTRLAVSPIGQTVPFDTPTLVETHLEGYDAGLGTLPANLRVLGDFSGPGIEGVVQLTTAPNEPFRIPRLRVKGAYGLSNIRLMQGDELLGYAEPRSVSVNATQILVTKVTARPLTQDEITSYGIVLDDDSYQTLNLTFGFAVNGREIDYNMPVVYRLFDTDGEWGVPVNEIRLPENVGGTVDNPRFRPPQMTPFKLELAPQELADQVPSGGCDFRGGTCRALEPPEPPMVGVILFPTELSLLHQFFSVVLMVQNGAPDGDPLTIRDLTAKASLPSGLRPASTEPPTPLGVPVPLRVPGPDGELGTADDVTFLIAQAAGEAQFLVEGLREGTHLVQFDLAGTLEGLPGGPRPITGKAKGAVVVRDPTLSVTISHPDVVRAQEEYPLFLTITNLGKAPVNALDVGFKVAGLAGTQIIGDTTKEVGNLMPGDTQVVEFAMKALVTGRVVSSSARAGSGTRPGFELSVGVGSGVPLSPESLVLPNTSRNVPPELYKEALGLIGLAYSLSNAPPSLVGDKAQATTAEMNDRIYRLSQMGRQVGMGEELFEAMSTLAAEWLGARDGGWEWDNLRRTTTRGREFARVFAEILATEHDGNAGVASDYEAIEIFDRFAASNHYFSPIVVGAYGSNIELEIASRTSGKKVRGRGAAATRELPFAELYPLSAGAELGLIARAESGGYEARLRHLAGSGNVTFELVLPSPAPAVEPSRFLWQNVSLPAGALATVVFDEATTTPFLSIDDDGDGVEDRQALPAISPLARRPFAVVKAVHNFDVDPSAHVVDLLFSADIDLASMAPRDPGHFRVDGLVSNGGLTPREESISMGLLGGPEFINPLEGLFNPRIVRVVFNNPIAPGAGTPMTVAGLLDAGGRAFGEQQVEIESGPGAQPGAAVVGQVIDPYGQALPYAEVSLFERDLAGVLGVTDDCVRHRTARTRADAEGRFRFDYVRQTACGSAFELEALDPAAPHWGNAQGVVRYVNQDITLNVVMLGRAWVRGRVTYSDGSVPPGLKVLAYNPVFDQGRQAKVMPNGDYQMAEVVVGTVTLYAYDELGNKVFQTIEVPSAGAEVVRDMVMLRQSATSSAATLRGRVTHLASGEPSAGAHVVLTLDGQELGVRVTDAEGNFDFGTVPTGGALLVVYNPATGKVGAQLAQTLVADQNAFLELHLRDDRGGFVGYVQRIGSDGTVTPLAGATVYVRSLPFHTTTDANGYYELPEILTGSWDVIAADLERQKTVTLSGSVTAGQDTRLDLYFREGVTQRGAITGTVYGINGELVRNATVHLAGDQWSVRWHHEALTDSQGRFRIDGIDPGVYGVHAFSGSDGAIGWATVARPGDVTDVGIHYLRSRVHGRTFTRDAEGNTFGVISLIRYQPVEVIAEWGVVAVSRNYKELTTNADGTFSIDALPGRFEMIVHNSFHGTQRREYSLGAEDLTADIEFQRSGAIHGVVYDHDGETPVPNVELRLSGGTFNNYIIHSDADGKFDFELLPPGGYGIFAVDERGGISRQGFISVSLRGYGDEVDVQVVLPKQGTVYGQVFDADWNPLANVAVTLRGDRYPRQVMTQNTDAEGNFTFTNVYVGSIALSARAPELGGLGGTAQAKVGMEGEEVAAEIRIEGVGELVGQVINPDTNQPVPNAEVKLEASGISLSELYYFTTNTDFEGRYRFDRLPLRSYRIYAFDPSTGRRGLSAWQQLVTHGEVVELEIELEVRGVVEGHLYDTPSEQTLPGITIKLDHSGMTRFQVFSSTDIDGYFEFGGIPEGAFHLETAVKGRRARAVGSIETEDQIVTRDLFLEPLARLQGQVRQPRTSAGPSSALADNVNVLLKLNGNVVAATTENPFIMEGLLQGNYEIEAREIDGDHQVISWFRLLPGDDETLDLELRAIGSATIHVFTAAGTPIDGGVQVTVDNHYKLINGANNADVTSPLENQTFAGTLASGNTFEVEGVRQGFLNVRVVDVVNPSSHGAAYAVTAYEGESVDVEVHMVPTGELCGTIYLPDGVTPAVAASVAVKPSNEGWRLRETDSDGHFCFEILPLKNFHFEAEESAGFGSFSLDDTWPAGNFEKNYTIVLDDTSPQVISISPAAGSTGVPTNSSVVIEFSEPVCRTCGGIYITNSYGFGIPATSSWSADGKTLTLQPSFASSTSYRVKVQHPLVDLAGRALAYPVVISFQTADTVPPKVTDMVPKAGKSQVPLATTLYVTFSEPIEPNFAPTDFQLVRLDQNGYAETLIPLAIAENRRVAITVVPDLESDHQYELRVQGIRDTSGNVMSAMFTSRFYTEDTTPPEVSWIQPAESQLFKAGDLVLGEVAPSDNRGIASVEFVLGGRHQKLTAAPWRAELRAPIVAAVEPVEMTVIVTDSYGNQTTSARTVVVEPRESLTAPVIGASCPAEGDWVMRGAEILVSLPVSDDHAIDSYELKVDGQVVHQVEHVDAAQAKVSYLWKPDALAAPGATFALELVVRDFANAESVYGFTVSAPLLEPLKSQRPLPDGTEVILGPGEFNWTGALKSVTQLTLLEGATLTGPQGATLAVSGALRAQCGSAVQVDTLVGGEVVLESGSLLSGVRRYGPLKIQVAGRLTVENEAQIDASGKGYLGGYYHGSYTLAEAPPGIRVAEGGGGSHGGYAGAGRVIGEVFDSVYQPALGGGGSEANTQEDGSGGGVIDLEAGELVLDGVLRSRGKGLIYAYDASTGAGGAISIRTGSLVGSGKIDVAGGSAISQSTTCPTKGSAGGGGRVRLEVPALGDFDPAAQITAEGGRYTTTGGRECGDSGPGTVYVRSSSSIYGDLLVDAGVRNDGSDREVPATELPTLGSGASSAWQVAAADAWLSRSTGFAEAWLGVWVELSDNQGISLGAFEAVERDGTGRLRLAGAGTVIGAATFKGLYRFDSIRVAHGAGIKSTDPLESTSTVLEGAVEVPGLLTATNLTVKSGAVVRPTSGGNLIFRVSEKLTIEAGAVLDVTGKGYPGAVNGGSAGSPAGIQRAISAGGSHGGSGSTQDPTGGTQGAPFDSIQHPQLGGGGGHVGGPTESAGGGVIDIEAGELELAGELRARGMDYLANQATAGGGGTVAIRAGILSGSGLVDVSGGNQTRSYAECYRGGSGGGGRASLIVDTLDGFDPALQTTAKGGVSTSNTGVWCNDAGPGTVYVKTPASTYGDLLIDAGTNADGSNRWVPVTKLPVMGSQSLSGWEVSGADGWVSQSGGFAEHWLGNWVEIFDAANVSLGTFEAVERDGSGRLRLAGAGTVSGAVVALGRYRFDSIQVVHGAGLESTDPVATASTVLSGDVEVSGPVEAVNLTVKSGAVVRPAGGGNLIFRVSGKLTVELGAVIDASGAGYRGGNAWNDPPLGPLGVSVAAYAGGSHGGQPDRATQGSGIGGVYDSVYRPQQWGGGAGYPGYVQGAGGGLIDIEATELELEGELRTRGYEGPLNLSQPSGAGGSVWLVAGILKGSGRIDAEGASVQYNMSTCPIKESVGGGGRVGLQVQAFDGFDPAAQVSVAGGRVKTSTGAECVFQASPGTVYIKTPSSTYGDLLIDAGTMADGADRVVPATQFPTLGKGQLASATVVGGDAWIGRVATFDERWLGVWVELSDATGAALGTFEVVGRDVAGLLRLAGAALAAEDAEYYQGIYRFDQIETLHGAYIYAEDPLESRTALTLDKSTKVAELRVPSLTIADNVTITPISSSVRFVVSGTMTVAATATVNVEGQGYGSSTASGQPAGAPPGVTGSVDAGGSHGGSGDTGTGTPSVVFDSVYKPSLGGGGGNRSDFTTTCRGAGVIEIEAGALALEGQLLARGETGSGSSAGAGGTVRVVAGQLSGSGLIDTSGGNQSRGFYCDSVSGGGGGGRVALEVEDLTGFDVASRVRAYSGSLNCFDLPLERYAGAGTVYVKTAASTFGTLRIDAGRAPGSTERVQVTTLPLLGGGVISSLEASGSDAWFAGALPFPEAWLGVWVELADANGNTLGLYEATEMDPQHRLRLAGAGGVTGASSYRGRYRFDAIETVKGGSLLADEFHDQPTLLSGNVTLDPDFSATDLVVKAGAVVRPRSGTRLNLQVSGTLLVEAGAKIDVSNLSSAIAPVGAAAQYWAGGSHGGQGDTVDGTAGDPFDSVYHPQLPGGPGHPANTSGNGGGVLEISAGQVVLEGELLARGGSFVRGPDGAAGAGGTVRIVTPELSGNGLIDAGGGTLTTSNCYVWTGGGGGGRVALEVADLGAFAVESQVKASAGITDCNTTDRFAAAGTVYVKSTESTYGRLLIDAGDLWNSSLRAAKSTFLPNLGKGAPSSLTLAGDDLWLARSNGFAESWLGVWVELRSVTGELLGSFEAAERDGAGRLRLAGAASAAAAAEYRGSYRFDQIEILRGAGISAFDSLHSATPMVIDRNAAFSELHAPSLQITGNSSLRAAGESLSLQIPGTLSIESNSKIDVSGGGYSGSTAAGLAAGAPAGMIGSFEAGGSHGGAGDTETGTAGPAYDSVYRPQLGGGGGHLAASSNLGRGGGAVEIVAGTVQLDGQILAKGDSHIANGFSAGAGGSVRILAAQLSGAGLVDAGGGTQTANGSSCVATSGGGGGGRVALEVADLSLFDVASQARARSGRTDCPGSIADRYAGAGTVYFKTASSTYGTLQIDAGVTGTERVRGTTLPTLGSGTVAAFETSGSDAWIARSTGFPEAWLGVWVELRDSSDLVLGLFVATELDALGRLHLAGAAAVASQASSFRGFYRFDEIVTLNGTGFFVNELYNQPALISGNAVIDGDFTAADLTLASGTVVRSSSNKLALHISGTLRVEAGAKIDVSTTSSQLAPSGFTAPSSAGGSHGGRGDTVSGTPGETFDSVYHPLLAGGSGNPITVATADGRGGGVIEIDAANVVLDGELLARGGGFTRAGAGGAGAGGTVRIVSAQMSGSGVIDASGGILVTSDCSLLSGGGGGGRVAFEVANLNGFVVDSQVKAWAGVTDCTSGSDRFAAAGTVYVFTAGSTYGRLLADAGEPWNGAPRTALTTVLPVLGNGALTSLIADGGDAWLTRVGGFPEQWWGASVELKDAGDAVLGTYRAVERDSSARLRLAGAAGVATQAVTYRGVYLFDAIDTVRGADVDTGYTSEGETTVLEGTVTVASPLVAENLRIKAGAVVKPLSGTSILIRVSGTMTVEAGAKIDVTGLSSMTTPSGFGNAASGGGGHGGGGDSGTGTPGGTYDSLYHPQMSGAVGTYLDPPNKGGGVIDIEAGSLLLDGELLAMGGSFSWNGGTAGAGGSVRIETGILAGTGVVDASGGNLTATAACQWNSGSGGGGRVALDVANFSGFDPKTQAKAWAGYHDCPDVATDRFAAAGTVYYRTASSIYGNLFLDPGQPENGVDRKPRITKLPSLGSGLLTGLTASGSDAVLVRSGNFAEHWWGVWVELRDAGGALLGTFEVVERDSTGKLRLAGASSAVGLATTYKGIYRFDDFAVVGGAGFESTDAVEAASMELQDRVELKGPITSNQLVVRSGATVKPPTGTVNLAFRVSGAMTVETGAKIDVTGLSSMTTPSGFGSASSGGGGHGGGGDSGTGTPGGTYDSFYHPQMSGAVGTYLDPPNKGGGVIDIEAGSLLLNGELLAQGGSFSWNGGTAGAGGSVRIETGTLSGAGVIDASGGNLTASGTTCHWNAGAGGGGRVSLGVTSFSGFDPKTQAKAWGGYHDCPVGLSDGFAAAGTIYYRTATSTYGNLYLDPGQPENAAPRTPRITRLPVLGSGALTSLTASAGDAVLVRSGNFAEHWWGAWVELRDSGGVLLGTFQAVERDATGKLRLAGASGAVGSATTYRGIYRLDSLELVRGAGFESTDTLEVGSLDLHDRVELNGPIFSTDLFVRSGSTVKPPLGSVTLAFRVDGTMTVEAGASIDVSAINNSGTPAGFVNGTSGGGGHGGGGDSGTGTPGGSYDSVYYPQLPGAKGGFGHASNRGGGVIDIVAGSLVLDGALWAQGASFLADGFATAAGGTVRVQTDILSGAGTIDASGGNLASTGNCWGESGAGGGGRVALDVASFSSFDPGTQVKVWAGVNDCAGTVNDRFAAAGTLYWKTLASTYGILRVDAGEDWNGVQRTPRITVLPTLGNGSFTSLTAAGGDAWLVRSGGFAEHWLGAWVELKDGSGTVIGTYEAVERASSTLRLAGASAAVGVATTYGGLYRFDEIRLRRGATLSGADVIEAGAYTSSTSSGDAGESGELESLALAGEGEGRGPTASEVRGRIWNDLDGDGALGSTEPPLVGVRIAAFAADGSKLSETISDRLGRFRFADLAADELDIVVDEASLPGGLALPSFDSDGIATAGRVRLSGMRLSAASPSRHALFGYRQADLVLPAGAAAPACATCAPATRATPAPPAGLVCDASAPFDTVFLLDLSGSLAAPFAGASSRLEAAQLAIAALERSLEERGDASRVALLTYRSRGAALEIALLQGLSSRSDAFEDRLFGLAAQDLLAGDGSPAAIALATAARLLAESTAAGHQPRIVWLTDKEPDVDAGLRRSPGSAGSLLAKDGTFLGAAEVAVRGTYSPQLGIFAGQASADTMVVIEEATAQVPGLRISAIALQGDSPAREPWREDLLDYAAAYSSGIRASAADLGGLEMAIEGFWARFVCQVAP